MNTDFTWAWIAWLAAFGVIEGMALYRKKGGETLSAHVWKYFPRNTARGIALVAFMAWLFWHFVSGEV